MNNFLFLTPVEGDEDYYRNLYEKHGHLPITLWVKLGKGSVVGCDGELRFVPPPYSEGCSCHMVSPCAHHQNMSLECSKCFHVETP